MGVQDMLARLCGTVIIALIGGLAVANSAPKIPSSEMPGRERERFAPSPLDRFTDPLAWPKDAQPLWRWCDEPPAKQPKKKSRNSKSNKGC
jgi:hypothetical protein